MTRQPFHHPARSLGLWPATALVVGHTIAVGIFLTPAELIGALASPALTLGLWVVCGALVFAGALTFGELASRYPLAGGPYIYLRQGWGERVAFLYGWQCLLILDPGITAALAIGLSGYIVVLWPGAAGAERWLAVAAIWTLALVSVSGLTLSARVLAGMTGLKLTAFAAVVAIAFSVGTGSWSHFQPFFVRQAATVPIGEALALGLISVFFSFGGFWEASRIASEVRNPTRTMPAALAIGVASVTAVYVATTIAFIYLVPVRDVTTAQEFARRAGEAMLGGTGPTFLAAIVVVSVATSALALLIMAPRLYVAMSHDGLFPSSIASVSDATGAPAGATLLLALWRPCSCLPARFSRSSRSSSAQLSSSSRWPRRHWSSCAAIPRCLRSPIPVIRSPLFSSSCLSSLSSCSSPSTVLSRRSPDLPSCSRAGRRTGFSHEAVRHSRFSSNEEPDGI